MALWIIKLFCYSSSNKDKYSLNNPGSESLEELYLFRLQE